MTSMISPAARQTGTRSLPVALFFAAALAAALSLLGGSPVAGASFETEATTARAADPVETVTIGTTEYVVPPPWTGNRVIAPSLDFSSFRRIPEQYTRNNSELYVVADAHAALVAMLCEAEQDGVELQVESGYRSERYQKKIFQRMLAEGRVFEDIVRYVAPPGYSNHMLGTAVDFYPSNWRFADTPAYLWLQENASEFGFEETYSEHNRLKMPWEAWHWSFVSR